MIKEFHFTSLSVVLAEVVPFTLDLLMILLCQSVVSVRFSNHNIVLNKLVLV